MHELEKEKIELLEMAADTFLLVRKMQTQYGLSPSAKNKQTIKDAEAALDDVLAQYVAIRNKINLSNE